jgi:LacI family transcriptional regulator
MRKVTIEDISRDTGLSRGTVSRALNDRPDISAKTKQRVLASCRKLNYVPSHAARSLATGRNYAVAVLVDDLRSAFIATFLRGVINRAATSGYAVHVIETGCEPQPDRLCSFSPERIDGVLNAVPLAAPAAGQLHQAAKGGVLTSCWPLEGVACDVLTPDQTEAGRMVTRFLLRGGLHEVLYVRRSTAGASAERLAGFQEICRERGIDPDAATATVSGLEALDGLSPRLEQADGIIADDDFLAIAIMLVCARLGRRPGEDLALIGLGNEPVASEIRPTLTSVDFNGEEIGRRTMETVLQRLGQATVGAAQQIRVAPVLVQRASTGPVARHG